MPYLPMVWLVGARVVSVQLTHNDLDRGLLSPHRRVSFRFRSPNLLLLLLGGGALGSYFGGVNVVVAIPIYVEGVSKPVLMRTMEI